LRVSNGVLNLNGRNQLVGNLDSASPYAGGVITNTGAPATFTTTGNATFGGIFAGNLNLAKTGNSTATFNGVNTLTGSVQVRDGILRLFQNGSVLNASAIGAAFGTLQLDNSGFWSSGNRIGDAIPLTFQGGGLTLTGGYALANTETLGTATVLPGYTAFTATPGTNGSAALTLSNLVRNNGAVVNFAGNNALGQAGLNTSQILLNQLNGATPTLSNNLLGPWAIVNGVDFATWSATQGVVALGAGNFAAYDALVTNGSLSGGATLNSKLLAAGSLVAGGTALNSLNIAGASNLLFSSGSDTLTLTSGGLLKSGNSASIGAAGTAGILASSAAELLLTNTTGGQTLSIFSQLTGGTLVLSGPGSFLLSPGTSNTYTGPTIINQSPVSTSAAAVTVFPGDLFINNAPVTLGTVAGQIAASSNVTINGGGALTLYGNNTLNSVTFNSTGGQATPALNTGAQTATPATVTNGGTVIVLGGSFNLTAGQLVSGAGVLPGTRITNVSSDGLTVTLSKPMQTSTPAALTFNGALTLGGTAALTAVNETASFTPALTGALDLGATNRTVNVSGAAPVGLTLSAAVLGTGGLVKTGNGLLALTGNGDFSGGVDLQQGGVIFGATTLTQQQLLSGPMGTGTLTISGDTARLVGANTAFFNPIRITNGSNTLNIGGVLPANNLTLNGPLTFAGGGTNFLSVDSPAVTATLGTTLTGTFAFTKTGNGILALGNPASTTTERSRWTAAF
jgi:autotransporter-associated beta strand protein